jgi:hypothetical protein
MNYEIYFNDHKRLFPFEQYEDIFAKKPHITNEDEDIRINIEAMQTEIFDNDPESISINKMKLEKFYERGLDETKNLQTFQDRFSHVRGLFTSFSAADTNEKAYHLFIRIKREPKRYISLLMVDAPYETNALDESEFESYNASIHTYHYIKAFNEEDVDLEKPILYIRSDTYGKNAELMYIHKGTDISGNQLKAINNRITDFLHIERIFLNDDATCEFYLSETKKVILWMRQYLPIVADSWYGRDGFAPHNCFDLKVRDADGTLKKITQSMPLYFAAVEKIKAMPLTGCPNKEKMLANLSSKYVTQDGIVTVHQLGEAIFKELRDPKRTESQQYKANRDFVNYVNACLAPKRVSNKDTKESILYNLALEVIWFHCIWVKNLGETNMHHEFQTFDQQIEILKKESDFLHWDDVAVALKTANSANSLGAVSSN